MENPGPNPEAPEPGNLKYLRRLVTVLTATMIAGVVLIITLLVIRFYDAPLALPETLNLPDGAKVLSFTQATDWYAIVTDQNEILIFDRITGRLLQSVTFERVEN